MTGNNDREVGELIADMRTVKQQLAEVREDTASIKEGIAQVKGGWRVVLILSAFAGAGLSWLTSFFFGKS